MLTTAGGTTKHFVAAAQGVYTLCAKVPIENLAGGRMEIETQPLIYMDKATET